MFSIFKRKSLRIRTKKLHRIWSIQPQLPWHKRPSIIITSTVICVSILGSYLYLNYTLYSTKVDLAHVTAKYKRLTKKYLMLKTNEIKLQLALDIATQSQVEIQDSLLKLHKDSQELTAQVDLYKRIMSVNGGSNSVLIENIKLTKSANSSNSSNSTMSLDDNNYVLSLALLQASKQRDIQYGKLDIKIKGLLGDTTKTLTYSEITSNNYALTYKFRDFQQFSEKITLPRGFKAENIIIIIIDNKSNQSNTKTFAWDLLGGRHVNLAQNQKQ